MKTTLLILASVLLALSVVSVYAGVDTAGVTASVNVPGTVSITANPLTFADTQQGNSDAKNLSFTVISNAAYNVTTKANAVTFTGGATPFNIANMTFIYSGTKAYTTNEQVIALGSAGTTNHLVLHTLAIPSLTQSGAYSVGITLKVTTA